jgi:hypothetical protein
MRATSTGCLSLFRRVAPLVWPACDDVRNYVPELSDSRDLITDDNVLEVLSRQKDLNFTPGDAI